MAYGLGRWTLAGQTVVAATIDYGALLTASYARCFALPIGKSFHAGPVITADHLG